MAGTFEVRRSADRFTTSLDWLDSKHSFSFGHHYEPSNVGHGLLLVNNDDTVAPASGYDMHPHRDMEIITWVLRGSLVHQDSTGHSGSIFPGLAQRMSAGTGILHSERNDFWRVGGDQHREPVRFIQMWVSPDEPGLTPGYDQAEVTDDLGDGDLVPVASGMAKHAAEAAVRIQNKHAALHVARLDPGSDVTLPQAPYLHLFVAKGTIQLEGAGGLEEGDAARLTATGGQTVTATDAEAEVLVWEMQKSIRDG